MLFLSETLDKYTEFHEGNDHEVGENKEELLKDRTGIHTIF